MPEPTTDLQDEPIYKDSIKSVENVEAKSNMQIRTTALSMAIGEMDEALQRLFQAISPVLSREGIEETVSNSDRGVTGGQSSLASYLEGEQLKIEEVTHAIVQVTRKVEL